ncbi:hypothetical protein [Gemmata sp.]|uniref:hypothetical protein n=1 Tax=Gemmata sp. TaxID=1914242 RepID=UPI003F712725
MTTATRATRTAAKKPGRTANRTATRTATRTNPKRDAEALRVKLVRLYRLAEWIDEECPAGYASDPIRQLFLDTAWDYAAAAAITDRGRDY